MLVVTISQDAPGMSIVTTVSKTGTIDVFILGLSLVFNVTLTLHKDMVLIDVFILGLSLVFNVTLTSHKDMGHGMVPLDMYGTLYYYYSLNNTTTGGGAF